MSWPTPRRLPANRSALEAQSVPPTQSAPEAQSVPEAPPIQSVPEVPGHQAGRSGLEARRRRSDLEARPRRSDETALGDRADRRYRLGLPAQRALRDPASLQVRRLARPSWPLRAGRTRVTGRPRRTDRADCTLRTGRTPRPAHVQVRGSRPLRASSPRAKLQVPPCLRRATLLDTQAKSRALRR